MNTFLIGFGAPRSGTTFLQQCLKTVPNVIAMKVPEMRRFHPAKSNNGLVELMRWLHWEHQDVTFVRIVRHPLEICESFEAARFHEAMKETAGGLADNTDERVVNWISRESENMAVQRPILGGTLVEIRYEDLAKPSKRSDYAARIAPHASAELRSAFDGFGQTPARSGRLSCGIGTMLTPQRRAWFADQLRDVIAREGYG